MRQDIRRIILTLPVTSSRRPAILPDIRLVILQSSVVLRINRVGGQPAAENPLIKSLNPTVRQLTSCGKIAYSSRSLNRSWFCSLRHLFRQC